MKETIANAFRYHIQVIESTLDSLFNEILSLYSAMVSCFEEGNKVLLMGNGGSATDAQHMAAELVGRFLRERKGVPAIALTADTSILTAVSNDYGYEQVFRRQIDALAKKNDLVIGISTSGQSLNVINALQSARTIGCKSAGLLGKGGGKIASLVDIPIVIPSNETPRIQETHITIIHILCELLDEGIKI